jgi:hypothetical protein
MIYDRTAEDVAEAIRIRSEKVQKFLELTDEEIATLEKGTLTINTLNRIESKIQDLQERITKEAYFTPSVTVKSWSAEQIFVYNEEVTRILNNIDILREAFYVKKDTPKNPNLAINYSNINDIEKILHDIESVLEAMISLYRECGTFECGEE